MGVFSLSCWKPQATQDLRWWDSFPLLPFIPQSSEGGGTEGSHVPLLAVEHQPTQLHKPTFLLVIVLPEEVPQEKNCCAKPLPGRQPGLQQASATLVSSAPITYWLFFPDVATKHPGCHRDYMSPWEPVVTIAIRTGCPGLDATVVSSQ